MEEKAQRHKTQMEKEEAFAQRRLLQPMVIRFQPSFYTPRSNINYSRFE